MSGREKALEAAARLAVPFLYAMLPGTGSMSFGADQIREALDALLEADKMPAAPLQGTQDALQGLREASLWVDLIKRALHDAEVNHTLLAPMEDNEEFLESDRHLREAQTSITKIAALLSSSTLQAGGWNYDMEAAPHDSRTRLYLTVFDESPNGKQVPRTMRGLACRAPDSRPWYCTDRGISLPRPMAWMLVPLEPSPAAPLPVSDKGGAQ